MAAPVCELCGATSFVKEDGMFTCQSCGTKYSPEEAQKLMRANATAEAAPAQQPVQTDAIPTPEQAAGFEPQGAAAANGDAREINNHICRGFQLLAEEYERLEHPAKERHEEFLARARECVMVLDGAVQLDPSNHEANLLIINNCKEIEDAVQRAHYYDQDEEGKWRSHTDAFCKVEIPGQKDSWDDKATFHRNFLEQQFVDLHTLDWQRRLELQGQVETLRAELDELKDEKRSKGFFNFSEKREVKERMKPVKDEIEGLNRQIRDIDRMVDAFVEDKLEALGQSYVRLSF